MVALINYGKLNFIFHLQKSRDSVSLKGNLIMAKSILKLALDTLVKG